MDTMKYTSEERNATEVLIKNLDFRTVIALAMIQKTSGGLTVNFDIPEWMKKEEILLWVATDNEEFGTAWMECKNLSDVFSAFPGTLKTECDEICEIFNEDFVKRIDSKIDGAQNNICDDAITKYMNCMLAMCLEDVSWKILPQLIKIGEALIEDEEGKATKKYDDHKYLATQKVEGKIMVLEKPVSFNNIVSYIDALKSVVVDFIVLPCNGGYKYSAIPITENSDFVRKAVPEQLYRLPIVQIRGITGAGTLISVDSRGLGGICEKYEDALKMAKLAVSLTTK